MMRCRNLKVIKEKFENITFFIKSFDRPQYINKLLLSIDKYYGYLEKSFKIFIVDDGLNPQRPSVKVRMHIDYYTLPHDSGLGYCRNFMLDKTTTEYFVLIDDNFIFTKQTNIEKLYDLILESPDIDLLAGSIYNKGIKKIESNYRIEFNNGILTKIKEPCNTTLNGLNYYDFVVDFFIAKVAVVKDIRWDDELKILAHTAFFMNFKKKGYIAAEYEKVRINHIGPVGGYYKKFKTRNACDFEKVFFNKYGIKKVEELTPIKLTLRHVGKILKKTKYYPLFIIYFISYLFPRKKNLWVFGTYNKGFNDNTKYLYLNIIKRHKDLFPVWICRNRSSVRHLRSLGVQAYYKYSCKGIFYLLRAKYHFTNMNLIDTSFWLSGGAKYINLWHGIGLKHIEFNVKKGSIAWKYNYRNKVEKFIKKLTFPSLYKRPDLFLVPSYCMESYFKKAFKLRDNNILYGSYPRNQVFSLSYPELKNLIEKYDNKSTLDFVERIEKYRKRYIYMPTFRDGGKNFLDKTGLDFYELNFLLKEKNECFIIKLHPIVNVENISIENFSNIIFLKDVIDIYPVLPFTDVLITDYSSIYIDYLLLDKEILFFCFDLEEYIISTRGICFEYNEITPGKKCYSYRELYDTIKGINHLDYRMDREVVKNKFWDTNLKTSIEDSIKCL